MESFLRMMKNVFYFILKALFVLKIFTRLDYKDRVKFKIHDVTTWFIYNYNTQLVQYLTK